MTHAGQTIDFVKMNGCGNDFVVIDARTPALQGLKLTPAQVQTIAARDNPSTKGCDQVLIIHPPKASGLAFMEIRNADGGEVEACGNGARAVAAYLHHNDNMQTGSIETLGGTLKYRTTPQGKPYQVQKGDDIHTSQIFPVSVVMPPPKFDWQDIPLNKSINDTSQIKLHDDLPPAFLVNLGNPHAVFFVNGETENLAQQYDTALEQHPFFPEYANINFAQIEKREDLTPSNWVREEDETTDPYIRVDNHIKLHTWERGVGLTKSCGTGACASAIACHHLFSQKSKTVTIVSMEGGVLKIDYDPTQSPSKLEMQGRCEFEFNDKVVL